MRQTKYTVALTEAERAQLRSLVGSGTAPARTLTRARILLKANQGEGGPESLPAERYSESPYFRF